MATTSMPAAAPIEGLREQVRGEVLTPGDSGYDEAREVWNATVDKHPAAIVRATGVADVIATVNCVREHDLPLTVKGGGHNFAGKSVCDDGVMLDLAAMNDVRVDPGSRTAQVGPGATWGELDHEAQAFGLATTGGVVSHTGVAGLTLGGGLGWLMRKHGLAVDNLVGADVVTADGELVHASADEHADLFWGLRGGGGNFGVVTRFEFRLHEVGPEILGGPIFHRFEDARACLEFYREFAADAPDELACYAFVINFPPEEPFPEALRGTPSFVFAAAYAGDSAEGERALAPLREFGEPVLDGVGPLPYTALQAMFDEGAAPGNRWYSKSQYLAELPDEAIDVMLERSAELPGPLTQVALEPMGGAVNRVDPDATAFPHRGAAFNFGCWPGWMDPADDEACIAWAREFHEAMAPFSTGGVYVNYLDSDEPERVQNAYGDHYERLVDLKTRYDPENVFGENGTVEPRS